MGGETVDFHRDDSGLITVSDSLMTSGRTSGLRNSSILIDKCIQAIKCRTAQC